MKYMILGGGGSFGINTALHLLSHTIHGDKVIGVGRNPLREPAWSLGVEDLKGYEYRQFHLATELDLFADYLEIEQPEIIINYAAQGEGAASWKYSYRFYETNAAAMAFWAEWLVCKSWFKHFIHIGTSEVYGSCPRPATEDAPVRPTSPYAASKLAFDFHLMAVSRMQKFPMTIIRPSNCYCPGQLLHRIVPRAIVSGLTKRKLPLQGGGVVQKSYLHALDLAEAIRLVAEKPSISLGKIYNVGPENPISIRELVQHCAYAIGMSFDELVEMAPARASEDQTYWLDSSRIRDELGWAPQLDLETGLIGMNGWAIDYLDVLRKAPMGYTLHG